MVAAIAGLVLLWLVIVDEAFAGCERREFSAVQKYNSGGIVEGVFDSCCRSGTCLELDDDWWYEFGGLDAFKMTTSLRYDDVAYLQIQVDATAWNVDFAYALQTSCLQFTPVGVDSQIGDDRQCRAVATFEAGPYESLEDLAYDLMSNCDGPSDGSFSLDQFRIHAVLTTFVDVGYGVAAAMPPPVDQPFLPLPPGVDGLITSYDDWDDAAIFKQNMFCLSLGDYDDVLWWARGDPRNDLTDEDLTALRKVDIMHVVEATIPEEEEEGQWNDDDDIVVLLEAVEVAAAFHLYGPCLVEEVLPEDTFFAVGEPVCIAVNVLGSTAYWVSFDDVYVAIDDGETIQVLDNGRATTSDVAIYVNENRWFKKNFIMLFFPPDLTFSKLVVTATTFLDEPDQRRLQDTATVNKRELFAAPSLKKTTIPAQKNDDFDEDKTYECRLDLYPQEFTDAMLAVFRRVLMSLAPDAPVITSNSSAVVATGLTKDRATCCVETLQKELDSGAIFLRLQALDWSNATLDAVDGPVFYDLTSSIAEEDDIVHKNLSGIVTAAVAILVVLFAASCLVLCLVCFWGFKSDDDEKYDAASVRRSHHPSYDALRAEALDIEEK